MSRTSNLGDKTQITAGSTTVACPNQQNVIIGSGNIGASSSVNYTFTSPLIDAWTLVNVNAWAQVGDAGGPYSVSLGILTPTGETLNLTGSAAVITPGSIVAKITNTTAVAGTHPPVIGVEFQ